MHQLDIDNIPCFIGFQWISYITGGFLTGFLNHQRCISCLRILAPVTVTTSFYYFSLEGIPNVTFTLWKINMEPEKTPLEEENHLPNHHFQVRFVNLPRCTSVTSVSGRVKPMILPTYLWKDTPNFPFHLRKMRKNSQTAQTVGGQHLGDIPSRGPMWVRS